MLFPLDNNFVINEGGIDKIQPKYWPILLHVIQGVINKLGDNLISIHVRGSVCVGRAISNISDIDCVVIVRKKLSKTEINWQINLIKEIEKTYSFLSIMDLTIITQDELFNSNEFKNLKVYLKTQSVCLYGEDVTMRLPKIKPGKKLAISMYGDLENEINRLRSVFAGEIKEPAYLYQIRPTSFWCIWLSRVLLRSGLGLVMMNEPVYTQDLKDCYRLFSQEFREHKKDMHQALVWALKPSNNRKTIINYIDSFTPKYLKLWQEAKK